MTKDFRPDIGEQKYSFDDVQGVCVLSVTVIIHSLSILVFPQIDEAKEQVQEIVEFLKNPMKFKKLGAKLPTGMHCTYTYMSIK